MLCYHISTSYVEVFLLPPSSFCSEIYSEVLRLTDGLEIEGRSVHREGRRRSSRSTKGKAGPSSDALYMSNGEEIRESHVNDRNIKRKPRLQKKKSGYSLVHCHKLLIFLFPKDWLCVFSIAV